MTNSRSLRRRAVWAVPAITLGAVGAAALLPSTASAGAHPILPPRSAAELLAAVQGSTVTHLSGEVVETARLGLPELPGSGGGAALSLQTFITGTHTLRLWVNGPDQQRVALLGQLAESDVVRNGSSVWTYASDTGKASHFTLPAPSAGKDAAAPADPSTAKPATPEADLTPLAAANQVLAKVDPTTRVSVDPTARVAGEKAYTLVLEPKQSGTTVRKVLIAIDAAHNVPLRVQVFGAAIKPAFETAFQNISFRTPAAQVFRFTPPKGSTVATPQTGAPKPSGADPAGTSAPASKPKVLGTGWSSILALPAASVGGSPFSALTAGSSARAQRRATASLTRLTKQLSDGNQLLSTALVNVLITPDGRMFIGAVTPTMLEQAAAGTLR